MANEPKTRPALRVPEVLSRLEKLRLVTPPWSKSKVYSMVEDGTWDAVQLSGTWYVFEDSFNAWIEKHFGFAKAG